MRLEPKRVAMLCVTTHPHGGKRPGLRLSPTNGCNGIMHRVNPMRDSTLKPIFPQGLRELSVINAIICDTYASYDNIALQDTKASGMMTLISRKDACEESERVGGSGKGCAESGVKAPERDIQTASNEAGGAGRE